MRKLKEEMRKVSDYILIPYRIMGRGDYLRSFLNLAVDLFRFPPRPIYYRVKSCHITLKSRDLPDALGDENNPQFVSVSIPDTVPSELTAFLCLIFWVLILTK
jgi:hypothetical protein